MSVPHLPKVAGINSSVPQPAQTPADLSPRATTAAPSDRPDGPGETGNPGATGDTGDTRTTPPPPATTPGRVVQERLAGWVTDLATLHDLTDRLAATRCLDSALQELLRSGAALIGARRGLVILEPPTGTGHGGHGGAGHRGEGRRPALTRGLGLTHAELGHIETIPRDATAHGRILDAAGDHESRGRGQDPGHGTLRGYGNGAAGPRTAGTAPPLTGGTGTTGSTTDTADTTDTGGSAGSGGAAGRIPRAVAHPDIVGDLTLDPHGREVAHRLGCAASYTQPLATETSGTLGAAVWLYDEPGAPTDRRRHLVALYARYATEHLARLLEVERAREAVAAVTEELLPTRLPRVPGVLLAARHRAGGLGGGDWYDALALPEGALGLAVGSVNGSGPGIPAVMGRLRASLRAYAVMEGEDPVAVLSDLELLLRLTEPSRTATALFAHAEPAARRMVLAGAGHTPPLVIGERRTEYIETSLSAPLGMLACWEAPSVELSPAPGETVLLYTDGLLRQTGDSMDRAFARLHTAASGVPTAARANPGAVADHILRAMLPPDGSAGDEDVVLLAARFD
ncbi:PP2C family protein-serine/threonine phosphatase [Streptomyces sp. NPDC000594]|uniref:PP2C family protein-serine/threonine phosphatase n=1 Tax=Streptomyces sp. NPDC000594 TaxID=3154261 RepID=UPI0033180006